MLKIGKSKTTAAKILDGLSRQAFVNWYEKVFEDYITQAPERKTEDEILEDIKKIFEV